jgi:endonuclease G
MIDKFKVMVIPVALIASGCSMAPPKSTVGFCINNQYFPADPSSDQVLCKNDFAIGYDYSRKSPSWAVYRVSIRDEVNEGVTRSEYRFVDEAVPELHQATLADYQDSGYIKGKLVPESVLRKTDKGMHQGDLLSNSTPQLQAFSTYRYDHHGIWGGVSTLELSWAAIKGDLLVFTGPIYKKNPEVIGEGIPVPSAFYKIYYDEKLKSALSFVFPHKQNTARQLESYKTTIDCIESLTKIDFMNFLNEKDSMDLEGSKSHSLAIWAMKDGETVKAVCSDKFKDLI